MTDAGAATGARARLAWIDNLRLGLMAVVIAHHAGQAYGPTGGYWPVQNETRSALLGPFFTVNAAFGMGLFFLLAGYFVPASYDRKGARRFLQDRLVRLALPLLFMSFIIFPIPAYLAAGRGEPLGSFLKAYLRRPAVLHLWFLSYLLVFTCGYVVWRRLSRRRRLGPSPSSAVPGSVAVLGYALGLALVTFLVRIWFPVDRWIDVAPLLRVEPAHLPQYASLFGVGIAAARGDWLRRLPSERGRRWLAVGLAGAAVPYVTTLLGMASAAHFRVDVTGGFSGTALVWSTIEALIVVGLSVGLVMLFRDHADRAGAWLHALAGAVYTVYLIHVFVVVALQRLLVPSGLPPLGKFVLVTAVAVPLSFALGYGLRKLPWVGAVL